MLPLVYRSLHLDQWFPDSIALKSVQSRIPRFASPTDVFQEMQSVNNTLGNKWNQIKLMVPGHIFKEHLTLGFPTSIPPQLFFPEECHSFIFKQDLIFWKFHRKKPPPDPWISLAASSNQASVLFSMSSSSNTRHSHTKKNDVLPVGTSHFSIWNYNQHLFRASQNGQDFLQIFSEQKHRCQFCLELLQIATHLGSEINY